jgi:hypothetical protein
MRAALEPDKPSVRQLELTVLGATPAEGSKFQLVQARKRLADKRASLTVLMAPPSAQGIAYLMEDKQGTAPGEYTYVPIVRRVRKLVGAESQSPVLDSDFTFADLGFVPTETQDKIVGEEKVGSHDVYKIESIPSPETQQWYYSKVVTWIDKQSLFPVQRDFYSPAGQVFRIQTFGEVARVDGVPTILETTIETVGAQSRSKLRTTSITYGRRSSRRPVLASQASRDRGGAREDRSEQAKVNHGSSEGTPSPPAEGSLRLEQLAIWSRRTRSTPSSSRSPTSMDA